ncbi:hypothetical protein A3A76_03515 [Candidatus Woesebacteria bacterium RIFCSPLOWO2_01_FULL_39_23]|uniref:Uncharacterized protein n=1 Tax=Candidatus Woesebacteria bacterium RIFCSPHIGHO2_01_FULL_40_22 TaxID=1802499 RepID=A0A1F7YJJ5_9BACT|nr:MAG: hypothetical protein A2141_00510 [Candidatus Woesebacteria bacterium RBG_16_40_11]OGM27524.1 MAG: hypothetical protein A2628_01915 [Candidatus Woesebacteria bacterium RIFCSPHIGHO2_01_FULL_40_22]OGM36116.1 MAG: hypothetical protein A3E41_02155 [Candidatus Woesebacteria bacterium RIFCSPHIGHO2_12_FULL_38_9]OGM62698.1 MAG: hypothetical protein A3A76_03515 [Candidatus Woesebacteria bacterium RIFCSPLOWO2_01_FULL_39_23]
MKKYLPFIILLVGVIVLVGAFLFVKNKNKNVDIEEGEETIPEIALKDRPFVSLTPSEDGHWLNLKIERIRVSADSLDYELLYNLPDGRIQGVPGTIKLEGSGSIERKLLMGSESSGKFRYDEGVKDGSLSLKFRDEEGKLAAKFMTDFNLFSHTETLVSKDNKFSFNLSSVPKTGFFIVMQTFGLPKDYDGNVEAGPYGIFSSTDGTENGEVALEDANRQFYFGGDDWVKIEEDKTYGIGVFIGTSES